MNVTSHLVPRQQDPEHFAQRLAQAKEREPLVILLGQLDKLAAMYGEDTPATILDEIRAIEFALAMREDSDGNDNGQ